MAAHAHRGLGVIAYAFEPKRRSNLRRVLRNLAAVAPWPQGSSLVIVRRAGQPPFGDPVLGLPVQELENDGRHWEFGAWQAGVERLGAASAAWLLLNDTAGVNDPWSRSEQERLRHKADGVVADPAPQVPLLAGMLKRAPAGCSLEGLALPVWVQTHAVLLSAPGLQALGGSVFDRPLFEAPQIHEGRIHWPDCVSPSLAAHVEGWLTRPGKDGWRHHTGRTEVPDAMLRDKAGAILLEKRLAAQVLAAGGRLVDCADAPGGAWHALQRRAFYWRRRLRLALPQRPVA